MPRDLHRSILPALLLLALPADAADSGRVTAVVSGHAIEVSVGESALVVQLLGVRAPRAGGLLDGGEPYGDEALGWLRATAVGQPVTLVAEPGIGREPATGRPRRYVHLADGRLLNEILIANGFASVDLSTRCELTPRFLALERRARGIGLGMWNLEVWRRHVAAKGQARSIATPRPTPDRAPSLESYVRKVGVAPWEERKRAFEAAVEELADPEGRDDGS